jgi:hypothetical protein
LPLASASKAPEIRPGDQLETSRAPALALPCGNFSASFLLAALITWWDVADIAVAAGPQDLRAKKPDGRSGPFLGPVGRTWRSARTLMGAHQRTRDLRATTEQQACSLNKRNHEPVFVVQHGGASQLR